MESPVVVEKIPISLIDPWISAASSARHLATRTYSLGSRLAVVDRSVVVVARCQSTFFLRWREFPIEELGSHLANLVVHGLAEGAAFDTTTRLRMIMSEEWTSSPSKHTNANQNMRKRQRAGSDAGAVQDD
jgi:hypothetical protein